LNLAMGWAMALAQSTLRIPQVEEREASGKSMRQPEPVICAVARTPIGKFLGGLSSMSAVDLGVVAVKAVIERSGVDVGMVDEILFGQVLQAGAGQAPARQVALGAGLPNSIAATTINKVCGSGLKTVMLAATAIRAGEHRCIIAGGMESMSKAPHFIKDGRKRRRLGDFEMHDSLIHDGLWDVYNNVHMGNTGETVAKEHGISREDADSFSVRSHTRAAQAWDNGWFDWEVVPVSVPQRRKDPILIERDEGFRGETSMESLGKLRAAFDKDGQVTAGNASQISDGAAAVLVVDRALAEEQGWEIICTIVDQVTCGVEPAKVMSAPIPAIQMLLTRNDLAVDDVDLYEHNEAFAAASCSVAKVIGISDDKFNVHGGAVALGHPLGASGTRCLISMIGAMRRLELNSGIVTLCLGGGNAVAMLIQI
jgi:acetyl-CoA C-acetyltransferase